LKGRGKREGIEEETEREGREEGEEREARKNREHKKAKGIVFWNIAEVKKGQRFLGLFRKF